MKSSPSIFATLQRVSWLARKNHRFSSRGRQDAVVAGRTDLNTLKA